MLLGHVRDYAARVLLILPGEEGELTAECVVDTGFEGDLALPRSLVAKLERLSAYVLYPAEAYERAWEDSQANNPSATKAEVLAFLNKLRANTRYN